jgi:hypothetical protein
MKSTKASPAQADHYPLNVPDTSDEDDEVDDDEDNNAPQETTHQMSREGNWKERKLQEWKTKLQECADHSAKTKE